LGGAKAHPFNSVVASAGEFCLGGTPAPTTAMLPIATMHAEAFQAAFAGNVQTPFTGFAVEKSRRDVGSTDFETIHFGQKETESDSFHSHHPRVHIFTIDFSFASICN
jgi:hypothetical protein